MRSRLIYERLALAMKTWSGEHMELPETWPDFVLKTDYAV